MKFQKHRHMLCIKLGDGIRGGVERVGREPGHLSEPLQESSGEGTREAGGTDHEE